MISEYRFLQNLITLLKLAQMFIL